MVHSVEIAVPSHRHVQSEACAPRLPGDDACGGDTAAFFGEDGGKTVVLHFFNQVDQLLGGSFAAGFFLDGFQNFQIKGLCEIGKAVMEGNQIAAGEGREGFFTIGIQVV